MTKYRAVRTFCAGRWFDSKAEVNRYLELLVMGEAGLVTNLELQPWWSIHGVAKYRADFAYDFNGERIIEDVKGVRTAVYALKKKLVEAEHGIVILEVR